MGPLQLLLLFLCAAIPGVILFREKNFTSSYIKPLLSLSGTFLLALSFCHLLPEAYDHIGLEAGIFVLIGFFLQVVIESFTQGVEHGHYHHHGAFSKYFPVLVIGGLMVHAIIESLPMVESSTHSSHKNYLLGILLHKAPIALTLASILKSAPLGMRIKVLCLLAFALAAPLTIIFGSFFPVLDHHHPLIAKFEALAVGIFLHVSTTILFESEDGHSLNPKKLVAIILGLLIYFLTV